MVNRKIKIAKLVTIMIIINLVVLTIWMFSEILYGMSGKRNSDVVDYLDDGKVWHAKTQNVEMSIYMHENHDTYITSYRIGNMEGVWGYCTGFGASMEHIRISFYEIHNPYAYETEESYSVDVLEGIGRIEDDKLIIKFDENDILPEGIEELTFQKEGETKEFLEREQALENENQEYNEQVGKIGYSFITPGSEWKTSDNNIKGIKMKLKEEEGEKIITYNVDGKDVECKLQFPKDAEPDKITSFNLIINKEYIKENIEEEYSYIYDESGKETYVNIENVGTAIIYENEIILVIRENYFLPQDVTQVVLHRQQ